MSAKNPPKATPVAAFTAVVIAVALIAVAVVGVHDLAVTQKWAAGTSWSRTIIEGTNGATRADWVVPLAVIALLIGLFLLFVSFRPRRSTHQHVPHDDDVVDVWIAPAALANMAKNAAEDAPGVLNAHPKTSARRVRVSVGTTPGADQDQVVDTVQQLVGERIGSLSDRPIKVYTRKVGT